MIAAMPSIAAKANASWVGGQRSLLRTAYGRPSIGIAETPNGSPPFGRASISNTTNGNMDQWLLKFSREPQASAFALACGSRLNDGIPRYHAHSGHRSDGFCGQPLG